MDNINQLVDEFVTAYQHSLYAIEKEQKRIDKIHEDSRKQVKTKYEKKRSLAATEITNNLMAGIHQLKEAYERLIDQEDSVVKSAEYLAYGSVVPKGLNRFIFSDCSIPWVMPFLGHKNLYIESSGDACQSLGVQFVIEILLQTAPGQLNVTVINPEIRADFSVFTRLPGFKMLTRGEEIQDELRSLTEVILRNDTLLQGKFESLVELRNKTRQPVGQLQLLVFQDVPGDMCSDFANLFSRISKGAPRAGIAVIFLNSKASNKSNNVVEIIRQNNNFFSIVKSGNAWKCNDVEFDKLQFDFHQKNIEAIANDVDGIIEGAKKASVLTIPFDDIEDVSQIWNCNAGDNIEFKLGKMGLDTVSVGIGGGNISRYNILISGAAGQGKSNLIEVMLFSLCLRYSPEELELYLLDFKDGMTFKPYASFSDSTWLPHAKMLGLESDRDIGLAILKDIEEERQRRAELFKEYGVQNYEDFRRNNPGLKLPRIVVVIDEYQKLVDIDDDISRDAAFYLENLPRLCRAFAIHIVLASQSITGAYGLIGREDRIYAQFPIRIALKNTLEESHSIFGPQNDAAAELSVRGEAVLNNNYGDVNSNCRFVVAYAQPDRMKDLRRMFCEELKKRNNGDDEKRPVIFTSSDSADFSMFISSVKEWRREVIAGASIHIPLGIGISIKRNTVFVPFANEIGKNVAIIGSAENLSGKNAIPGKNDMAIGMVQGICISLALQHPQGDARFVAIDGLAPDVRKNSNFDRWLKLMERFGFPVEVVESDNAVSWLMDFRQEIKTGEDTEDVYVMCFGMDRIRNFSDYDMNSGGSGAEAFQELIKNGSRGVHFICCWSNVGIYKSHIGFDGDGYFGTKVLLRMDGDTAREVMGPFVSWGLRNNRALIRNSSDLAEDTVVMPLLPISDRVCGMIESVEW